MWKTIVSYFPDWPILLQAFFVFFIPYAISKFFLWIRAAEGE
ncbi:hypothetical protein VSK91_05295 [Bacillus swezeyi]